MESVSFRSYIRIKLVCHWCHITTDNFGIKHILLETPQGRGSESELGLNTRTSDKEVTLPLRHHTIYYFKNQSKIK